MPLAGKQKLYLHFEYVLATCTFASNIKLKSHWPENELNSILIMFEYLQSSIRGCVASRWF